MGSTQHFKITFDGIALRNGEIDVRDLAPALLALGELVEATNTAINGQKAHTNVGVRATAHGSFEVALVLSQSLAEITNSLLDYAAANKDGIANANELFSLIFNVVAVITLPITATVGLYGFIKWLNGKKPDKIETHGNNVHVSIGEKTIILDRRVIVLAENVAIRTLAEKSLSALSKEGIDSISIKQDDHAPLILQKEDLPAFALPEISDVDELLSDSTSIMRFQIISLSFNEDNKWRVTDGSSRFIVAIEDESFLTKIANSDIAFAKNDYLVCRVREKQYQTTKGLKKDMAIIQVLEHRQSSQQLRLL